MHLKNRINLLYQSMRKNGIKMLQKLIIPVILLIIAFETILLFQTDGSLDVYFLDVGQGDSILVKTPSYRYILIDGGEGNAVLEELGEVLPFWKQKLDVVIGTHADSDHIGGLVPVVEKYQVGAFFINNRDADDLYLHKIAEITTAKNIPFYELNESDAIRTGELDLDILWPEIGFVGENDNQSSVVIRAQYRKFSFMLTGDIEREQEVGISNRFEGIESFILKASHHGSKTASTEEFLREIAPAFAVVSCGTDNRFGHPALEVIERFEDLSVEILRTDKNGRIVFRTNGYAYNYFVENDLQ